MTRLRRYRTHGIAMLICLVLGCAWAGNVGGIRETLRDGAHDLLIAILPVERDGPVVLVVDIDRDTLAQLGNWPWPREKLALLLEAIAQSEPAAIGLDIQLDGSNSGAVAQVSQTGASGDEAIAESLGRVPAVLGFVLDNASSSAALPPSQMLIRGQLDIPDIWMAASAVGPSAPIAALATGFGAIVLLPDVDGRIRRVPLLVGTRDGLRPGMAAELSRIALGASGYLVDADTATLRIGPLAVPLARDGQLRFVPTQDEFRKRRTISATAVLTDPMAKVRLRGQIVLIGSGAPEVGGLRVTAFSAATPSVQIQADAMETLVHGDAPVTPIHSRALETVLALTMTALAILLSLFFQPVTAAIGSLTMALAWISVSVALFWTQRLLVDPVGPTLVTIASFGVFSLAVHADNVRRARLLQQSFEQHLAPEVVRRLVKNPELVRFEGEMREITAMFTDIEGFTSMTERSEARKLVSLLDEYLDELTQLVLSHGGMVEKVVGDSIHAIFNAPLDLPDHPRRALDCAVAILAASEQIRNRPLARELGLGRTRIGIETGMVIVGDVGGRRKLDYTAHGNAMNTAARLEAANKELGSSICVGPGTAAKLDPRSIRPLGLLTVRGRTDPLEVFTPSSQSEA